LKWDTAKLGLAGLSLASVLLLSTLGFLGFQSRRSRELTIAAGSARGESRIIAEALKTVIERHHPGFKLKIRDTAGTSESLRLLETKTVDLAAAQADVPAGPAARLVAVLYEDKFQLMVPAHSAILRFPDLRGKRIALPQRGGQFQSFLHVAEHYGMGTADFQFLGEDDDSADRAFLEGRADAAFRVRALSNPAVTQLARRGRIRLIPIHHAAAMQIKYPAFAPSVIPEGAYSGEPPIPDRDLSTVAVERTLLAHRDTPEEAVQALTSALLERRQELALAIPEDHEDVRPLLAGVRQPNSESALTSPLHPGAASFYDRLEPSFIQANADLLALLLTIVLLIGSWTWELKRWLERGQKNKGDEYNHQVVVLLNRAQATNTFAELEQIRQDQLEILNRAVDDLDRDQISEESFQSFRVVWQIASDMIRERKATLEHIAAEEQIRTVNPG
jgi:TRAP transporter TAXI family solute receptor